MADEVASPEASAAVTPLEQIVERYIALRDRKTTLKGEYEKSVAKLEQAMERIEMFLLKQLNDSQSESVRTKAGTFFKSTRTSATCADGQALWDWVMEDPAERAAALEKRVSKAFVEAYEAEHNDLPPGVNVRKEVTVNVRRS
jgi:hypothetical protein